MRLCAQTVATLLLHCSAIPFRLYMNSFTGNFIRKDGDKWSGIGMVPSCGVACSGQLLLVTTTECIFTDGISHPCCLLLLIFFKH